MQYTVLLPLDGSAKDDRAIAVAAAFAELTAGDVHIMRVIAGATESRARVERNLSDVAARLTNDIHRFVAWEVVEAGDIAAALLENMNARAADFTVMATRAPGTIGRVVHGSVADRVVRQSSRPVVLVPPRAGHLSGKQLRIRRILVPIDRSRAAVSVVVRLAALPSAKQLELVLLQVVQPERVGGYMFPPAFPTDNGGAETQPGWTHVQTSVAERQLEDTADEARSLGATVMVHVVEADDPAAVILDATREDLVDLIAMTTRGEGGWQRFALGSVATDVLRHSDLPVLLVKQSPSLL